MTWDYIEDPRLVLGNLQGFLLSVLQANVSDFFPDDAISRSYYTDTRRTTRVGGLEIFRLYDISVAARTVKGAGPRNGSVIVRTHGEGKWTVFVRSCNPLNQEKCPELPGVSARIFFPIESV